MKFGLSSAEYDFILKTVVNPLSALGAKVYCYGSRARGDHREFSDLDLMIEAPGMDVSRTVSAISETLENSNFPYKVDLVDYSQFAESYKPNYQKDKAPF